VTSLRDFLGAARAELPEEIFCRWAAIFFSLFVLTLEISLAASQAFLAAAGVAYIVHLFRARPAVKFPPIKLPLGLFCLLTILSVFWASNSAVGWLAVRKLALFAIFLLAVNLIASRRHLRALFQALFFTSALAGAVAMGQFVAQYRRVSALHPGRVYFYMTLERITGFMGHWMNFSGQQMLAALGLAAFLLLARRAGKIWWIVMAVAAASIVLSFTRGVWLGCLVGGVYLIARWKPRWLLVIPILLLAGYLASPRLVRERVQLAFHPTRDPALSIRFEMWRNGWRMIQAHPWLGVGPNNIVEVYDLYLPPGKPPEVGYHNHLHNNFIQFAAERGLPCLAAWIWLMVALGWHAWRIRRRLARSAQAWIADAALAGWLAFVVEGCFEFNFGTSPVLMVFLFVMSTPFVAERWAGAEEDQPAAPAANP
jgi:putative inorganic carbon (hco3(-)) transporter